MMMYSSPPFQDQSQQFKEIFKIYPKELVQQNRSRQKNLKKFKVIKIKNKITWNKNLKVNNITSINLVNK